MQTENGCLDLAIVVSVVSFEKTCSIGKWEMEFECKYLESLGGEEVETIINTNTHNFYRLEKTFPITYKQKREICARNLKRKLTGLNIGST